jgi:TPR repeat protein
MRKAKRWVILAVMSSGAVGLALSIQDGWTLIAKANGGDRSALQTLVQAYERGDAEAATAIGVLYLRGLVYPLDPIRARKYFEWAEAKGSGWASYWLAIFHAGGLTVPMDLEKAFQYAERGAKRGYIGAKLLLLRFRLVKGDISTDRFIGEVEAEAPKYPDEPVALHYMGMVSYIRAFRATEPQERQQFLAEASKKFARAVELGHPTVLDTYAWLLYFGVGTEPDQKKALDLARPYVGLFPGASGLYLWDLYFGNVQARNQSRACQLAGEYFARPELRVSAILRTVYGLCLMDVGKRVEGYAHLLKASATDFLAARALAQERAKELSKEELERAKALLKDLP